MRQIRHRKPRFARGRCAVFVLTSTSASAMASAWGSLPPRCDFNGDGFDDLAIAIPNQDIGSATSAGAVQIIYGSINGPRAAGNQLITQESQGVPDSSGPFDRFGSALAWGDFNGDGFSDLAIGTPLEDVAGVAGGPNAGAVTVIYGSGLGLDGDHGVIDAQQFREGFQGLRGSADSNDQFGWSLAVGDFDGDGLDDLAIGVIGEDLPAAPDTGAVHVLYGRASGLSAFADEIWNMNTFAIPDIARQNDRMGYALATGDFDGDGRDDLAIGAPGKPIITANGVGLSFGAGATVVVYGSETGLRGSGAQTWTLNSTGVGGVSVTGDSLGHSLASGDFNGDGRDDLAIGAPFKESAFAIDAGYALVLLGTNVGLRASENFLIGGSGVDVNGRGANTAFALASADFDRDGFDDLAVSSPRQQLGSIVGAGSVLVCFGSVDGLPAGERQFITQDSPGVLDRAELEDRFGESLWTGDFNGDGRADLVIGVPRENVGGAGDAGLIHVLFGRASGLPPRDDQTWFAGKSGLAANMEPGAMFGWRVTVTP